MVFFSTIWKKKPPRINFVINDIYLKKNNKKKMILFKDKHALKKRRKEKWKCEMMSGAFFIQRDRRR